MIKKLYTVVLIIVIILSIVGCSSSQRIGDSVNGYLEAIKEFRISEVEDYMSMTQGNIINEFIPQNEKYEIINQSKGLDLLKTITSKIEYDIISINTKGKKAAVIVNIRAVDSQYALKESYSDIINYFSIQNGNNIPEGKNYIQARKMAFDKMTYTIMENINNPKSPYIENRVKLNLTYNKKSGRWTVDKDEKIMRDLLNAVSGNFPKALEKVYCEK